ncbi:MAG: alpha/beta hydrolase-fold protein, partial [Owenweeksia sp.]
MKKNISLFVASIILMISGQSIAQQTGSFNTQVTIMGESRTLACYVPANYDPNVSYRLMIGLHGLGHNGNAYRNNRISNSDWPSVFPNTIFVFPDGGTDPNSDFYAPAGDEVIIDSARSFAMNNYNIDSNFVVLQGFSLGGRSAIKYGLDHPTEFKGLLLNTPAFQGKNDWDNHPLSSLNFNYANADQIPIYMMVGDQDLLYYMILKGAVKKLKRNNAILRHINVAGLAHAIPDSAIMARSFEFFQSPEVADFDV